MTAVLDHVVVNARTGLDRAEARFRALGFHLTPRGHHTLGSINHLAMFGADYLELIGVPEEAAARRPEVALAPSGLNGLVFRSEDIEATHRHLAAVDAAGDPPREFSRPVTLADGSTHDACFRTVAVRPGVFPAGRLYFCQHLTPELLWRPEWQKHPNGATGFAELVAVAAAEVDPRALAARVAEVAGAAPTALAADGARVALPGGCELSFLTLAAYRARFGRLARAIDGRGAMLGALVFTAADPAPVAGYAASAGAEHAPFEGGLALALDDPDCLLAFRAG